MAYAEMAEDVRASLAALGHRRFALLGHSMGGKVAMLAALRDPDAVERLVVADIAPVAYQPRHLGLVRGDAGARPRRRAAPGRCRCASRRGGAGPGGARLPAAEPGLRRAARRGGGSISRRSSARCLFLVGFPPIPPGTAYAGRRCLSAAGDPTICAPSTSRRSGGCSRERGLPASRRPVTGCTPKQPQAFLDLVEPFLAG